MGYAMEVHLQLGPGLGESIYESALAAELEFAKIAFNRQVSAPIQNRGKTIGNRIDLIVDSAVVVE